MDKREDNDKKNTHSEDEVTEKDLFKQSLNEIVSHLNNTAEDTDNEKSSLYMVKDDHRIPIGESQLTSTKDLVPVNMDDDDDEAEMEQNTSKMTARKGKKDKTLKINEINKMIPHRADFSGMGHENVPILANDFEDQDIHFNEENSHKTRKKQQSKEEKKEKEVEQENDEVVDSDNMKKLSRKERKEIKVKSKGAGISSREYVKILKEDKDRKLAFLGRRDINIMEYPTKTKVDYPVKKPMKTSKIPNAGRVKTMSRERKRRRRHNNEV